MTKKEEAVKLIKEKLNNSTFLTYKEISAITGYHPKYILKLKKEVINGTVNFVHGNKNRVPSNSMSEEEKQKIIKLYKKVMSVSENFVNFTIDVAIHVYIIYSKKKDLLRLPNKGSFFVES